MTERPSVSIVVPFFDREATIAACIESLLGQREVGGAVELILIDNRSTDGSRAIAERYPEVTLLDEETPGAYAARNTGIRQARADLIALTDADCVADPTWVRAILDGMRREEVGVLLGRCDYPAEASWTLHRLGAWENAKAAYVLDRCPPAHRFAYCNNMAVRASVFETVGPFEEWDRAADSELVHRLAAQRPELEVAYSPGMGVTHLEFTRARDRARRMRLYRGTNARIGTFRELGPFQKLGVLMRLARSQPSDQPATNTG